MPAATLRLASHSRARSRLAVPHWGCDNSVGLLRLLSTSGPSGEDSDKDSKSSDPSTHKSGAAKHWTEASNSERHWLDRRLPGLREWLEGKNEKLWLRGVVERCRQYTQLNGKEDFIKEQLSKRYTEYLDRYGHMVVDERSHTHLQMGALMLATKTVLSPWIRDIRDVESIIKSHMGDFTSPVIKFLLKYVLYLSRDPFLSTKRRLHGLRLDYGKGFDAKVTEGQGQAELKVEDCFYQRLFKAENSEHLLSACCCSQDRMWFENLDSHGIIFERERWKGSGDTQCCLKISNSNVSEQS